MEALPNILENLSNALQSVQALFGTSNIADVVKLTTQSTTANTTLSSTAASNSTKITSSLETISNAINSLSSAKASHTDRTPEHTKSPVQNSLKLQQMKAPPYNPTPIKELKKRADTIKNEACDDDIVVVKKRKKELCEEVQEISPPQPLAKKLPVKVINPF